MPWGHAGALPREGVARLGNVAGHRAPRSFSPWHQQRDTDNGTPTPAAGHLAHPADTRPPRHSPVGWELSVEGMKSSS